LTAVTLLNKDANEIINIVRELRSMGLVQGTDFDFAYNQSRWDGMIGDVPKKTEFTFREGKNATWFVLKWGS